MTTKPKPPWELLNQEYERMLEMLDRLTLAYSQLPGADLAAVREAREIMNSERLDDFHAAMLAVMVSSARLSEEKDRLDWLEKQKHVAIRYFGRAFEPWRLRRPNDPATYSGRTVREMLDHARYATKTPVERTPDDDAPKTP